MTANIVVYGLSTEGYAVASKIAAAGEDVHIVDETGQSAVQLNTETVKIYSDVASFMEDERILPMMPVDVAIADARYLFFTPKISKMSEDVQTVICSKFKDAIQPLSDGSSVVYTLPVGFDGNADNISFLEHVTGLKAGESVSYYYYPLLSGTSAPRVIGSLDGKPDDILRSMLSERGSKKEFVSLATSEYLYAMETLTRFTGLCSRLDISKFVRDGATKDEIGKSIEQHTFLDDMAHGLYDLRVHAASLESASSLSLMANCLRSIESYIKRLINEIRTTLKKKEIKSTRIKVAISWTLDQHEMRGEKAEVLSMLVSALRDYVSDVETYRDTDSELFRDDRAAIVLVCSKKDYENIIKKRPDSVIMLVLANTLQEIKYYPEKTSR